MSVFSRATVMPTSQCSTSPGWMTGSASSGALPCRCTSTLGWNHVPRPLIVDALAPPPHEIARPRLAGTMTFVGEHRLRHLPDERGHLLEERFLVRQPRRDEVERQPFGVLELRGPGRPERARHAVELAARQAVGEREDRRSIDADDARLAFFDDGLQQLPLLVAPELGLLARGRRRRRSRPRGSCALRTRRPARCRRARCARCTTRARRVPAAAHLSKNT